MPIEALLYDVMDHYQNRYEVEDDCTVIIFNVSHVVPKWAVFKTVSYKNVREVSKMVLFEKKVHDYIEEQQLIEEGDRLLIACSGGLDSMGLLHFFIHYKRKCKIQLYVAHVDHMLRGDTSLEDRRFVEQFCNEHDIPIFSTSIPIPKILEEEGGNSQAICRRERYNYFANIMSQKNIHKLVTAHHADDQLESMLMSLVKSGNMTGLKGISAKREFIVGTIIRPFLMVTKMEIWQYLLSREGTFREDASNLKMTILEIV